MVLSKLFSTRHPQAHATNEAGGPAYALSAKQALAQYAATGCLGGTFYSQAQDQLNELIALAAQVDDQFLAKVAVYARHQGKMKDVPALLLAVLSMRDAELMKTVFPHVIDNPKMIRVFVQIMRSGAVGRKSLGSAAKGCVRRWLSDLDADALLRASVGNRPSLPDLVKMVHPCPKDEVQSNIFSWLLGKEHDVKQLPDSVRVFEQAKQKLGADLPDLPYPLLSGLPLEDEHWKQIARNASWQVTRMSLNSFARHGVFNDHEVTRVVANRLKNPKAIEHARVLPYQLLTAWMHCSEDIPVLVREALQDAMEIAISNVPFLSGNVAIGVDVSGSMMSPVTGYRGGSTTKVSCLHAAALFAAAILRRNRQAQILPFHTQLEKCKFNPRDTVMTNAQKLIDLPSGGTDCAVPLKELNKRRANVDLVILISDCESWIIDRKSYGYYSSSTGVMNEWQKLKKRNPNAKLVCLDMQPYGTTQAPNRPDIMNVGGFSDAVFSTIGAFNRQDGDQDFWVRQIEAVQY